jgi:hypothetical protein
MVWRPSCTAGVGAVGPYSVVSYRRRSGPTSLAFAWRSERSGHVCWGNVGSGIVAGIELTLAFNKSVVGGGQLARSDDGASD